MRVLNGRFKYYLIAFCFIVGVNLFNAPTVGAFFLTDWLNAAKDKVKEIIQPQSTAPQYLNLDSKIYHAKDGDLNTDGQFDAGETITFEYVITNTTDKEYIFAKLETNIPKDKINFIHDVRGTASLSQDNNTVIIPNLRIGANQILTIQFNARLNYFQNADEVISTQPKLRRQDSQILIDKPRVEIKARPLKDRDLPSIVRQRKAN